MSLWDLPVRDVRPMTTEHRALLIELLDGLAESEWLAQSAAPGWNVRDLALHLLDGDLGWLSRRRDQDRSASIDMSNRTEFVGLLADKNQRWVDGARGLSRRLVTDRLSWSGNQVDSYHAAQDLRGEGRVSWAGDGPVPFWFNLAQEFTERWVHQQQMREAVGRVEGHDAYLPEVLRTFVWAFPHQFRAPADAGVQVQVDLGCGGTWCPTSAGSGRWSLAEAAALPAGMRAWSRLAAKPLLPNLSQSARAASSLVKTLQSVALTRSPCSRLAEW